MMPFACWVFALLFSDSSALSAGPLTRRPRPWRRRFLSAAGDNEVQRPKRFRKLIVPGAAGVLARSPFIQPETKVEAFQLALQVRPRKEARAVVWVDYYHVHTDLG